MVIPRHLRGCALAALLALPPGLSAASIPTALPTYTVTQVTTPGSGSSRHFYGYQGHAGNTPFSGDDSKLLLLRTDFENRVHTKDDVADIVVVDAFTGHATKVAETRAWNFQQGTMLYWNPARPNEEFIFNDRVRGTEQVEPVLLNYATGVRRSFHHGATPYGNGGMAQKGGAFLAINYGRLGRLRRTTGYADAHDWTTGVKHPANDGMFLVDVATGRSTLILSFQKVRDTFIGRYPAMDGHEIFFNHTMWNRDDTRIAVAARWFEGTKLTFFWLTLQPDGSDLREMTHAADGARVDPGHWDWADGRKLIGKMGGLAGARPATHLWNETTARSEGVIRYFTGGDIAVAQDLNWIASTTQAGGGPLRIVLYSRALDAGLPGPPISTAIRPGYVDAAAAYENRLDGSPLWSRDLTKIAFAQTAAVAGTSDRFRQMHIMHLQWTAGGAIHALAVEHAASSPYWTVLRHAAVGDRAYGDRSGTITALPAALSGADVIRTASGARTFTGDTLARFRVAQNADVFLAHADDITPKPRWLESWTATGASLETREPSGPTTFSVFQKSFTRDATVSLGPNGSATASMYLVFIQPLSD